MQFRVRRLAMFGFVAAAAAMTIGCAGQSGNQLQLGGAAGTGAAMRANNPDGNPLATKVLATLAVERITGKKARFTAAERPAGQHALVLASN